MKNKLYYFNALFDLELGDNIVSSLQRPASEMTVLFAPLGNFSDRILLDVAIDESYWSYLKRYDIMTATPYYQGDDCNGMEGVAWGWNQISIERLSKLGAKCAAPSTECVKMVNSRKFCNDIAQRYSTGIPDSAYCSNVEQVISSCSRLRSRFPVVIKPDFGNSGFGFYHINTDDDLKKASLNCMFQHGGAAVEPWCEKVYDFSSVCTINRSGNISMFRHCRAMTNSKGTFHGIYLAPHDPVLDQWKDKLEEKVQDAALEVVKTGYFGTLGFDSIVYREKNELKLAPVIEINARHVMSDIAVAVRQSCAPAKHCLFRTLSKKRLRLPGSYNELQEKDIFRFDGSRGCILVSPLRVWHGRDCVQPYRNTLFLVADSENQLFTMDEALRA
ncbi:MAG: hypothetical protein JW915_09150 [Chitinispirillaceae bacterium]|nr:hypothetical protein [Chitinispirillaceae bacterium]